MCRSAQDDRPKRPAPTVLPPAPRYDASNPPERLKTTMRTDFLSPASVVLALAITAAAFLSACDRQTTAEVNAKAQTAGDKIDHAAERAKEQLSEAAKKTEVAVNEGAEKLKPQLKEAGAELKPKLEAAGDKLEAAAQKTGEQISSATHTAESSDAGITASIKAKYVADPNLSALKIDVDTQGGVVNLNGLVKDDAARQRAEQIASSVKGVSSVKNHLTVKQG